MPLFSRGAENADDRVKQAVKRRVVQSADLRHEQFLIGREQFAGPRVADDAEGALFEVRIREPYGLRVCIWTTGYLTQNPIAATGIGEHDGGRSLLWERSENGKGTSTTEPTEGATTRRPLQGDSSPEQGPVR